MAGSPPQALGLLKDFPGRSPRVVWLLVVLYAANSSLGTLVYILDLLQTGEPVWVIDFPSFFMAADSVFNQGLSPYAVESRNAYRETLGVLVLPFLYPPYALPLLYPFSLFDYTSGVFVALALNTVGAAVLFRMLHQLFLVGIRKPVWYWSAVAMLSISAVVRETVFVGQVNLVAALSLLLAWRLLRCGAKPILAGVLIGFAVVTKTYFVLLALLFLPRWEWRPILGMVLSISAFAIVSVILLPSSLWAEWLIDIAPTGRYGTTPFPEYPSLLSGNQSINSALIRIIGAGETAGTVCVVVVGGLLAAVGLVLWRRRHVSTETYFDTIWPLMLVTIYLVAPLSWMHHLLFVIPGMLWLWADAAERSSTREMALLGIVGIWVGIPWPLPYLEDISVYLTLLPIPGIAALWMLTLRRVAMPRSDRPMLGSLPQPSGAT